MKISINSRRCSIKKAILKNFTTFKAKYQSWSLFLIKLQSLRRTAALWIRMFSGEYCENFKNTPFPRTSANGCFRKTSRNFSWIFTLAYKILLKRYWNDPVWNEKHMCMCKLLFCQFYFQFASPMLQNAFHFLPAS